LYFAQENIAFFKKWGADFEACVRQHSEFPWKILSNPQKSLTNSVWIEDYRKDFSTASSPMIARNRVDRPKK